jgi:hypothetical protein
VLPVDGRFFYTVSKSPLLNLGSIISVAFHVNDTAPNLMEVVVFKQQLFRSRGRYENCYLVIGRGFEEVKDGGYKMSIRMIHRLRSTATATAARPRPRIASLQCYRLRGRALLRF